ncbi:MAG: hypothetical protein ACM3X9_10815 [Bacillota bacterium]
MEKLRELDFLPIIAGYLNNQDKVSAAWLFGSTATGKEGKNRNSLRKGAPTLLIDREYARMAADYLRFFLA